MPDFPYENPVPAESLGVDSVKLQKAVARFHLQQSKGAFPGGQLVIRCKGKLIVNETAGYSRGIRSGDGESASQVQVNTTFPVLSAGKPLAAIVIAYLEERGLIDVDLPIAHYFPEFGHNGKEKITTLHVLTHRSGIQLPDFVRKVHLWSDRAAIQGALIQAIPKYPVGTQAYQPYEYGWVLSELVQRIDGRTLSSFFDEEISGPLGLANLRFGLGMKELNSLAFTYWLGKEREIVASVNVAESFEAQNSKEFLGSENPSVSLLADAANLAAFYEFLFMGGLSNSGDRVLNEETIKRYTTKHVYGWDRSLRTFIALGMGFVVGTFLPSPYGWLNTKGCFGHPGGFCTLAFGDHKHRLSAAIITNGSRNQMDFMKRFLPLAGLIRAVCR